jgi:hypothetical protein
MGNDGKADSLADGKRLRHPHDSRRIVREISNELLFRSRMAYRVPVSKGIDATEVDIQVTDEAVA